MHCFCVSQKPVCVTASVMADNLIVFHTLVCQGFLFFFFFPSSSPLPISALKPTKVYKYWALILRPPTARPAVWRSTNDWVFMSEISSGRPLFPLSVDVGANKKLRKCRSLHSTARCVFIIISLEFLDPWTQYKSIADVKSHLAMRGRLWIKFIWREDVAFFERVTESDNFIQFHTFY